MPDTATTTYPRIAVQQRLYHDPCLVQWDAQAGRYTKCPIKIDQKYLRDSIQAGAVIIKGGYGFAGIYRLSEAAAKYFTTSTGQEVE